MKRFVLALIGVLICASSARAELVFFQTGRTMSVKNHRVDGDMLVLTLRTGGEMSIASSAITDIKPDEVPYPEDLPPAPVVQQAAAPVVPFAEIIDTVAAREGVSPNLVRAVIKVESAYQERARSRKGAMGLMQLMPETARQYAVANPYEAQSNIEGGIRYLKSLLDRFELPLALAAYNAGEAAVKRFGGIPPYPETRKYVADIMKLVGR
ncbi:MAG TPA: lytic transglycosylase domain-containing protein [Vicinamibacterales bacterium]|nr:lytic transglycosylase domain-containing protein [Vicinamibacterales bacterium]